MKVLNVSNALYTSAFALALGLAAPHAMAGSHEGHSAGNGTTQEQMDRNDHKQYEEHKKDISQEHKDAMKERSGPAGTGTTGPGSENPGAPAHVPGGTNPDGAPDATRSNQ